MTLETAILINCFIVCGLYHRYRGIWLYLYLLLNVFEAKHGRRIMAIRTCRKILTLSTRYRHYTTYRIKYSLLLCFSLPTVSISPSATLTILKPCIDDDRVVPLHTFKHAATLQHKLADNPHPILVRIEQKAGHGAGKSTEKRQVQRTFIEVIG